MAIDAEVQAGIHAEASCDGGAVAAEWAACYYWK